MDSAILALTLAEEMTLGNLLSIVLAVAAAVSGFVMVRAQVTHIGEKVDSLTEKVGKSEDVLPKVLTALEQVAGVTNAVIAWEDKHLARMERLERNNQRLLARLTLLENADNEELRAKLESHGVPRDIIGHALGRLDSREWDLTGEQQAEVQAARARGERK